MTSTTERAEPMKGLAEWLREQSRQRGIGGITEGNLLFWASEVESLQPPAINLGDALAQLDRFADSMAPGVRATTPRGLVVTKLATPAKAVVTDERAEFEKWWNEDPTDAEIASARGVSPPKSHAWIAWNARAVLQASTSSDGVQGTCPGPGTDCIAICDQHPACAAKAGVQQPDGAQHG